MMNWNQSVLWASTIPSFWTISLTPLAELQPQTRTDSETAPYFTESHKHSFLRLSPTLSLTHCWRLDPKISNLDSSLDITLFHQSSFQSLWALEYLSLFTLVPFPKVVCEESKLWETFFPCFVILHTHSLSWCPLMSQTCWYSAVLF